jgi:HK97 family phage portal protein
VEYVGQPVPAPGQAGSLMMPDVSVDGLTVAELWRAQPQLRTVVSFVARNVAQLGLHVFELVNDTDRRRDRTSPAAQAFAQPDVNQTIYDLIYALVGDMLLYDRAYWFVGPSNATNSGLMLRRLPPTWVTQNPADLFTVKSYSVVQDRNTADVPAKQILDFTGYSPASPLYGSPTVESLRETLREQIEAAKYRSQVWRRGGRVSTILQRPADAPEWSNEARERFREDWYAKYTGNGKYAGGTPILEDGMTINRIDFNAREQQFVEAAKLSLQTVASAFHVNPTMIGLLDNANYSNVREFRRMLYGDTLGPLLTQIETRLNTFLLPMLGMDSSRFYAEFNIQEKLKGSFEEQAQALQASVGRPWMTADEARGRLNLPGLGGDADQLVTPMNVMVGGQASPQDSGSQNRRAVLPQHKAKPDDTHRDKAAKQIANFFVRQERIVRGAMGRKSPDWWDEDRWDNELSDDLHGLAVEVSDEIGKSTAKSMGFDADEYDADRTRNYLKKVADKRAESINAATRIQLEEALQSADPDAAVDSVWDVAKGQRSGAAGAAVTASAAGFATTEAGRQLVGDRARKTWNTGENPRDTHAAMDGETVGLDENFSNSMAWPGDSDDADQVSGCNCSVTISVGD